MNDAPAKSTTSAKLARRAGSWLAVLDRLGPLLGLVVIFALFAVVVPQGRFVGWSNLQNIGIQSTVVATAALGATMVIIAGGIDLSVGSMIAVTVVVIASVLKLGEPELATSAPIWGPLLALLAGITAASLVGVGNGALITSLRIVPFIVTLGTLSLFRGLAKGLADEKNIYPKETWLNPMMDPVPRDEWWRLAPPGVWVLIVAALAAAGLLRYTRFGRHVCAIGSNEQTARLCGVPVARTKIIVYGLAGLFAGLAGLMQYSYLGIGNPTTAFGLELLVIAAVVIGGGSLMGGEGSITGTVVGALIITTLAAGGVQMGWPKWVQEAVTGAVIVLAVALDRLRHRRAM